MPEASERAEEEGQIRKKIKKMPEIFKEMGDREKAKWRALCQKGMVGASSNSDVRQLKKGHYEI